MEDVKEQKKIDEQNEELRNSTMEGHPIRMAMTNSVANGNGAGGTGSSNNSTIKSTSCQISGDYVTNPRLDDIRVIMENTGLIEFGKNVLFTIDRNGSDEKTSVAWDDVAEFFDEPSGEDMVAVLMPEGAFEDISEEVAEIDTSVERVPEAAEAEAEAPKKTSKSKGSKKKK